MPSNIIEDIGNSFGFVNEKINKLNDASAKDFKSLSDSFKDSYSQITELEKNTKSIFEILSDERRNEYYELINRALGDRTSFFQNLKKLLKEIYTENNKDAHERNDFFVITNNLKQNINTYKFLIANFHLKENALGKKIDKEVLDEMNRYISSVLDASEHFIQALKENDTNILKVSKEHKVDFVMTFSHISELKERVCKMLNDKSELILAQSSELDKKSTDYSESYSKIITNLQYQDIIRQKIEHIYEAHNSALADIAEVDLTDKKKTKEISITLGQIREITEIQAAQLLHTNKEYQHAINIIVQKFKELADIVDEIADLGNYFFGNTVQERTFLYDIKNAVEVSSSFFVEVSNLKILLEEIFLIYRTEINLIAEYKKKVDVFIGKIIFLAKKFFVDSESSTSNVDSLIEDLNMQVERLADKLDRYSESLSSILKNNDGGTSLKTIDENTTQFIKSYNKLLKTLKEDDAILIYKITQNKILSEQINKGILTSIDSVIFYKYFEKTVSEITDELEKIRERLMNEGISAEQGERVIKLKEMYTMQTEHDVHDAIADKKGLGLSSDSEENDDLELF